MTSLATCYAVMFNVGVFSDKRTRVIRVFADWDKAVAFAQSANAAEQVAMEWNCPHCGEDRGHHVHVFVDCKTTPPRVPGDPGRNDYSVWDVAEYSVQAVPFEQQYEQRPDGALVIPGGAR